MITTETFGGHVFHAMPSTLAIDDFLLHSPSLVPLAVNGLPSAIGLGSYYGYFAYIPKNVRAPAGRVTKNWPPRRPPCSCHFSSTEAFTFIERLSESRFLSRSITRRNARRAKVLD